MTEQQQNFQWYLDNQDWIVEKRNGETIAIYQKGIIGTFADHKRAYQHLSRTDLLGKAIIQKVSPGNKDYTQTFHNDNVSFKNQLIGNSEQLDPELSKIVNEKFWDLT